MTSKEMVFHKFFEYLEKLPESVFEEWWKNGSEKDYERLKSTFLKTPMPRLSDPDYAPNPEDEFPVGC